MKIFLYLMSVLGCIVVGVILCIIMFVLYFKFPNEYVFTINLLVPAALIIILLSLVEKGNK